MSGRRCNRCEAVSLVVLNGERLCTLHYTEALVEISEITAILKATVRFEGVDLTREGDA